MWGKWCRLPSQYNGGALSQFRTKLLIIEYLEIIKTTNFNLTKKLKALFPNENLVVTSKLKAFEKYREVSRSIEKYREVSRSIEEYRELSRTIEKYREVSK